MGVAGRMTPGSAAALGALGGAAVQITESFARLVDFQHARMRALNRGKQPPAWRKHFDFAADAAVLVARAIIGAGVTLLLRGQFTGALTALITGASGPLLLAQWGQTAEQRGRRTPGGDDTRPGPP